MAPGEPVPWFRVTWGHEPHGASGPGDLMDPGQESKGTCRGNVCSQFNQKRKLQPVLGGERWRNCTERGAAL